MTDWSDEAIARTREGLVTLSCLPARGGEVALKHGGGSFAMLAEADLLAGRLVLRDRRTGTLTRFDTVADLLAAGWVLD